MTVTWTKEGTIIKLIKINIEDCDYDIIAVLINYKIIHKLLSINDLQRHVSTLLIVFVWFSSTRWPVKIIYT